MPKGIFMSAKTLLWLEREDEDSSAEEGPNEGDGAKTLATRVATNLSGLTAVQILLSFTDLNFNQLFTMWASSLQI